MFATAHLLLLGDGSGTHLVRDACLTWVDCPDDLYCAYQVHIIHPQTVVFDTLFFESAPFKSISLHSITVSLSPVFSCLQNVDHLFHRTSFEDPLWKNTKCFPQIHKGLEYTVLPAHLKKVADEQYFETLSEQKLSIAISMGGADAANRTLALLQELSCYPQNLLIWIALGEAYTHSYEELLLCAKHSRQEVILLKSNESMWRVLSNVSLIICAGGLTTYEAAYVGIPSINILHSEKWTYLFKELSNSGVCHIIKPSEQAISDTARLVSELADDREKLNQMHKLSKKIIPSEGSKKIARKIVDLKGK
jgi:spore coat polysaccharide biosynthesis predicted glycosyltransferase SpsG